MYLIFSIARIVREDIHPFKHTRFDLGFFTRDRRLPSIVAAGSRYTCANLSVQGHEGLPEYYSFRHFHTDNMKPIIKLSRYLINIIYLERQKENLRSWWDLKPCPFFF